MVTPKKKEKKKKSKRGRAGLKKVKYDELIDLLVQSVAQPVVID